VRRAAVVLLVLAAVATPAVSFVLLEDPGTGDPPKWPGARAVIHHDPETFEDKYVTALVRALGTWSRISGTDFRFEYGGASRAKDARTLGNGSSDCYFDAKLDRAAYAVTIMNYNATGVVLERDVAFNANPKYAERVRWTTKPSSVAGGPVDFETVAVHELGHVIGLGHHDQSQGGVVSVMNSLYMFKDPAFPNRAPYRDDRDGVRALYPAGSGRGPDLVLTSVTATGAERDFDVTFGVRNDGAVASGEFAASIHLTGSVAPSLLDPLVGTTRTPLSLAIGEATEVTTDAKIPAGTPPGSYRIGVILDPNGATSDTDRVNNAATSPLSIPVTRPAIAVAVGTTIEASVGPFGTDFADVTLLPGTKVTFRSRLTNGTAALRLRRDLDVLAETKPGRKAVLKYTVETGGTCSVDLLSGYSGLTAYELKTKAKRIKGKEVGAIEAGGEVTIPVPAYEGSEVKIVVRGKKGFVPRASIDGLDAPEKTNAKGTKLTFGPFAAPETGEMILRVTGDAAGSFSVSWRVRMAKKPAVRVR